ncbi:sperm flagellar protein 1-like isoform X2 [Belonocnema kinseyi]|uniref:sperm flagellar protein 1-like isoform X2 n=1 Tax=Belonocnema kinseyi TaxID=2817044 RepID=UPI00143DCDDC|nr:sperm flagellar protein 1-like isoform X2 [Belonocnema kinseyi]
MSINADKGDNLEQIYAWLDEIPFSRPKKNTARDFSDGVLMAELLKKYYPRLVDVHNYIPGSSIAKKIDNWCTLNRKVLSKIEMKLSKDIIDKLANSQAGVIEHVLTDLHLKISKDCNADTETLYSETEEKGKEFARNAINPEVVADKTVPRHIFMKLKHELQEKKNAINMLSEKISHLESMLKLKDQRINDLTAQTTGSSDLKPSTPAVLTGTPKSRKSKM